MSGLTKLKLMRLTSVEREYRNKYPILAKQAGTLDNTYIIDQLVWRVDTDRIDTATKLNLAKLPFNDFCIVTGGLVPDNSMSEELEKLANLNLFVIIRLVRVNEHQFRVFYYLRQSDAQSYVMVYSGLLDDRKVGLVGEIDLNQKIITRDRGFHPGVIAISTFDNLINLIKGIGDHGIEPYSDPVETFAFRNTVPLAMRATHKHYRVKTI